MHEQFRQALEDGDVGVLWSIWARANSHLPQPRTYAEAECIMHYARSGMRQIPFAKRFYSHAWLTERNLPSGLPDRLRPKAERMYPVIKGVVGIAIGGTSEVSRAVGPHIAKAMSDAVYDAYAEGREEPEFVKARMTEARAKETRRLIGKLRE